MNFGTKGKQDLDDSFEDFAKLEKKIKVEAKIKPKKDILKIADEDARLLESHLLQLKEEIENEESVSEMDSIPISSFKHNFNPTTSPFNISNIKKESSSNLKPDIFSKTMDEKGFFSPNLNESLKDVVEKNKKLLQWKKDRIKNYGRIKKNKKIRSQSKDKKKSSFSPRKTSNQIKSVFIKKDNSKVQFSIDNLKQQIQSSQENNMHITYNQSDLPIKKIFTFATGEQENKNYLRKDFSKDKHFSSIIKKNINANSSLSIDFKKREREMEKNNVKLRRRNTKKINDKKKSKLKDLNMKMRNDFDLINDGKNKLNDYDFKSIKLVSKIDNNDSEIDHKFFELSDLKNIKSIPRLHQPVKKNIPIRNEINEDDKELEEYLKSLK